MEPPKAAQYYYHEGMLYRVANGMLYAMIEGKGWMSGWTPSDDAINEKTAISESEAEKIAEQLGEDF